MEVSFLAWLNTTWDQRVYSLIKRSRPCQDLTWMTPGGEKRDASQGQESPDAPRSTAIRAEVRDRQEPPLSEQSQVIISVLGKKKMYTMCHHWIVLVPNIFRELTDFSRNYLSLWPVSSISPIFKTPLDKHLNDFFHLLGRLSTQWDSLIFPKFSLIEACFALLALSCLVLNYLLYKTVNLGGHYLRLAFSDSWVYLKSLDHTHLIWERLCPCRRLA